MIAKNISLLRLCATAAAAGAFFVYSGFGALAHDGHGQGHAQEEGHSAHGNHATGHDGHAGSNEHDGHAAMNHRMPDHLGMQEGNAELAIRPDGFHYKRGHHVYDAPAVALRDRQGRKVDFAELLEFDGPILLNFIFTSCATICPVQSATFGQVQPDLAAIDDRYLMVSVSIDPEYDTPRRLREYAELHHARDNWVMLTGQFDDIFAVVRAFDAVYKGENKMYHRPLTFLRANADAPWLRLEGLLGAEELADEYAKLLRPEVN